jgi:glucosylceramidase
MVLDKQGGPNWFKNWCIAPVIADIENDEVYFTPLYYIMSHFSKFMRPGAKVLASTISNDDLMSAAVLNEDGSLIIAVFNEGEQLITYTVEMEDQHFSLSIPAQALQTIVLDPNE